MSRYRYPDAKLLREPMLSRRMLESLSKSDVTFLANLEIAHRIEVCDCDAERGIWLAYFGLVQILVDKQDRVYFVHDREAMVEYRAAVERSKENSGVFQT